MGDRLTVGQRPLKPLILVRLQVSPHQNTTYGERLRRNSDTPIINVGGNRVSTRNIWVRIP